MDIQQFKSQLNIVTVASDLEVLPAKIGAIYQGGKCPAGHESAGGKCFTVYPSTQSAHCFNCGHTWDSIDLVEKVKSLDFISACNWLSDKYNIPHLIPEKMTGQERAQYEARLTEESAVYSILTEAARWYHGLLVADSTMKAYLDDHYGLNDETVSTYSLGYSAGSGLWKHLKSQGYAEDEIIKTGLFVKVSDSWKEFYTHRLIFPYWNNGRVVYFIGRKTEKTPDVDWERGKYKKLPTKKDGRPYISEAIRNDWFYGEDSLRGHDTVFIAEGVTDCLKMLQTGFPTTSPVATRFKESDTERLGTITRRANTLYLVPDAEENQAGIEGAMDTADTLEVMGRNAYIVILPRPAGVDKVDVVDFLRDHGKEKFEKLVSEAKTPLQIEIDTISRENLDLVRLPDRLGPVKKKLAQMPPDRTAAHLGYIKSALNVKADFIQGLKKAVAALRKQTTQPGGQEGGGTLSALFPELVDLVINDSGDVAFLYKKDGIKIETSFTDDSGNVIVPPGAIAVPFSILPAQKILAYQADSDRSLYWDIFSKLKAISVLPGENYYHLCAIYIFFTYVSESSAYYPYLHFHGLPERGKSRMVKAIINLSYRGFYTETLNEAYIFRLADLFRISLALDLYEISERSQKKGSHDLLLGRYEQGMKVARVINPDKGAFKDMVYYTVSGPTVLATNVDIPTKDPLQSRCIKITMPEARGIYPNNNSSRDLMELKARMLAFRLRRLGEQLPKVDKPVAGRLGDIIHPLLAVAELLPAEACDGLKDLIKEFEEERKETESESLAGRIAQALWNLRDEVFGGRLPVKRVCEKINYDTDERYHIAPQTIGRELSAMGVKRQKTDGKMHIIFDQRIIDKIWSRFIPSGGYLPNLPNLPDSIKSDTYAREVREERDISPKNGPENQEKLFREDREIPESNLPDANPRQSKEREIREVREITSRPGKKQAFSDNQFEEGIL